MRGAALGCVLVMVSGCASITASRTEPLSVLSTPPDAEVRLNGSLVGTTPTRVEVPRQMASPVVEVSRAGYSTEMCRVEHSAGGGYVASDVILCVLFFPIGCVSFIDANGSWNQMVESQCNVSLKPTGPKAP